MNVYKIILSFIVTIILSVVGYFVYRRNPPELLNRLFLGGFEAYAVFFIFDALISLMYENILVASLCRHISSVSALFGASFIFVSSIYVQRGKEALKETRFLVPFSVLTGCAIFFGRLDERVVIDLATQSYKLSSSLLGVFFNYIYHALLILTAIILFASILIQSTDEDVKRRLKLLDLGLCTVVVGQLIQIILTGLLTTEVYFSLIIPDTIVYSLWAVGILIILGAFLK